MPQRKLIMRKNRKHNPFRNWIRVSHRPRTKKYYCKVCKHFHTEKQHKHER